MNKEPKEMLKKVKNGDEDCIRTILEMFRPLIYRNSFVDGVFDEDQFQELNIKLIKCIQSFEFPKIKDISIYLNEALRKNC